MSTFIKPGFWEKKQKGYANWLNLDELIQFFIPTPKYKSFTATIIQNGSSNNIGLYSGNTIIGVTYTIIEDGPLGTGYDFTVIGAPNNNIGTSFIATATTPIWGIDSAVGLEYNTGAPIASVLENTIGNIWFTYRNTGGYGVVSNSLFTINKTFNLISQATICMTCNTRLAYIDVSNLGISTLSGNPPQSSNGVLSDIDEYPTSIEIRVYN